MPRSNWCMCCNRDLTVAASIERGLGPICAAREAALAESGDISEDRIDLPFNAETQDIVLERRADGVHFNIYQVFRHHSPTGFEWGFSGSGPADLALNILALYLSDSGEPRSVKLWDGKKIGISVWNLHQQFKVEIISKIPIEGGVIPCHTIKQWIEDRRATTNYQIAA